ncbi:MAG: hypothetical protein KQ78_00173 [Candidatus Izimaplasma bacterium HR2]|nr:MAG: hypothetical protein KQ78_00173 [Candidatus Izimaplasma bacterium HR2]
MNSPVRLFFIERMIRMILKKYGKVLLIFVLVLSLSACGKDKYTISLYNGDELVEVIEDVEDDTIINLPILEEDGMLFVGYEDLKSVYYDEYIGTSDISLYAVFEVVTDVFEYEEFEYESTIGITGYIGNATHLKIPQTINGKVVSSIMMHSFEESNLVEVIIPVDARVNSFAFNNSIELKEVSFYGDYLLSEFHIINNLDYDEIMAENPDTCIITEGSLGEGSWNFSKGCPIMEVTSTSNPVNIDGAEYHTYSAEIDKNYFPLGMHSSIASWAFDGAISLETVQIPKADGWLNVDAFHGCISLKEIMADEESEFFTVLDGIMYNKDLTKLLYYPPSKKGSSYTLLDSLTYINAKGFNDNMFLETIVINEYYTGSFSILGLNNLKEIIVNENNTEYSSIDGILFKGIELVKYPAAKIGDSYTVLPGILSIGPNAFAFNQNLKSIDLGSNIINIDIQAFYGVEKLLELNIPSSVLYIEFNIIMDSSIDVIILNRSVLVDGSITPISTGLGRIDEDDLRIYVPDDSIDEYLEHIFWSRYSDRIYLLSEYTSE